MDKSGHGVRKAAATEAADNEATHAQLNSIFGWKGDQMASLYIESADRKSLAAGAIAKLSRTKKGTHLQQEAAARACRRTATKSIFMRSAALQAARAYVEPVKMIA